MDLAQFRAKTADTVIRPMLELIEEFGEEEYTREDVRKCENLMYGYLDALGAMTDPTDEAIMDQVRELVLALNDLNAAADDALIETMEREAIWEVVQTSAVARGLQNVPDDVTEEWREW